jgi:hypothetical protein
MFGTERSDMNGLNLERLFVLAISVGSAIACATAGGIYGFAAAGAGGAIAGVLIGAMVGVGLALVVLFLVLATPLVLVYLVYLLWARRRP